MQKSGIIVVLTLLSSFFAQPLCAQNKQNPWSIQAGVLMMKYQGVKGQVELEGAQFQPGIQLGLSKYLGGAFDFRTQILISNQIAFPAPVAELPSQTVASKLIDMNYSLAFKINNGVFLSQDAFIGPYLLFGIGGSYVENNPDAYVPLGGGLRLRLGPRMDLRLESIRKFSVNKDFQTLSHSLSLAYHVGKPKSVNSPQPMVQEAVLKEITPIDSDGDGILDEDDLCPNEPGIEKLFGCKEIESPAPVDKAESEPVASIEVLASEPKTDTIPVDIQANNPSVPTKKELIPQHTEVPEIPQIVPCNLNLSTDDHALYFELASAELVQDTKRRLDEIAELLKACPSTRLMLHGHTDNTGGDKVNHALSVLRAHKVKYYLVYQHKITQNRIESDGYGETRPVGSNETDKGREQNRRVDFTLIK